jgi:long-chain acyl-CoA synthetase
LHTGDLGAFDADGFVTLKDRSKDMIISGGSNIYPRELEEVLLRHTGVLEVSVVGRPIARYKRPRAYFFVDSLPKNNYGKVLKTTLRQQLNVTRT